MSSLSSAPVFLPMRLVPVVLSEPKQASVEPSGPRSSVLELIKHILRRLGELLSCCCPRKKKPTLALPLTAPSPSLERQAHTQLELGQSHSLTYNPATNHYTLLAPAPAIKNLVISGGGAKGVILPGVFRAFEEHRVASGSSFRDQLDHVAGSSIGAVSAVLLAAGMSSQALIQASSQQDFKALLGKGKGPIDKDGKPLVAFLRQHLRLSLQHHLQRLLQTSDLGAISDRRQAVIDLLAQQGKSYGDDKIDELRCKLDEVIQAIQEPKLEAMHITFSMLRALHELAPATFKELTITGTCRELGETFYFDADQTPDLDIAIASRASASLPIVLKPISIPARFLQPGYSHKMGSRTHLSFIDGGYFDNIPVKAMQGKQDHEGRAHLGADSQNLCTLALVFDETKRTVHQQSPFFDVVTKKHALYNSSSWIGRLVRDLIARICGRISTKRRNTLAKEEGLENIRLHYTQRCIPLLVDLKTNDFQKAKKHEKLYAQRGYQQGLEYLRLHEGELLARSFASLDELIGHLPSAMQTAAEGALRQMQPVLITA